ncbi:MAG: hypothetical protein MUP41_09495 [Desulfobacterales bacterium]|nr:hypothetical protein [Desulfobacterales bacterium]
MCEHEWVSIEGEDYYLGPLGETVEKNVICSLCGEKAREVYLFAGIAEEE